ncbi:MAG: T9SS type A sorting domain-containing protein [Rhodothermales bacterium]|nr:T9SS type A sorting domain-containing protein [Rhodothermales bacterium]
MYRLSLETRGASPEEVLAPRFGWDSGELELVDSSVLGSSMHLLYRQVVEGVPVWNRTVRVSLDEEERVTMVISGYEPDVALAASRPLVDASQARNRSRAAVEAAIGQSPMTPGSTAVTASSPELVIVPGTATNSDREATLAWRTMVWSDAPIGEYEVLVDAQDSRILHLEDQTVRRTGRSLDGWATLAPRLDLPAATTRASAAGSIDATGTVFDPDPLATSGADYGSPYSDNGDATTPEIDAQMKTVTLRDVTRAADGTVRLEGPYLAIVGRNTGGVDVYTPPSESDGLFLYDRSQSGFEAVNVYYHIDENQRYMQSLGFSDIQSHAPVPVNPQGTASDDSGWLASQRFLFFGTGGVDDGEDVAVVLHEYAHAILEGGAPGLRGTLEGQALHEGWSDYWAMSYQREMMEAGALARDDWEEVFRWDSGIGSVWPGRRLDFAGRYPDDTCSDGGSSSGCSVHNDGRLWGTVMMEVYSDLGREITDRLNLLSHRYLTSPVTFADAAEAVIQADIDHYDGAHVEVLIDRFDARGLVSAGQFGPIVTHAALPASEDAGGTATVQVQARAVGGTLDRVEVQWRHGTGPYSTQILTESSAGSYTGDIPLPAGSGSVSYFIRATDADGRQTLVPANAPDEAYSFEVGPDTEAPAVIHTPVSGLSLAQWPPRIDAQITDNLGVRDAVVDYTISIPGNTDAQGSFALTQDENSWQAEFPIDASEVAVGTTVIYTITVHDRARSSNRTRLGPYTFEVSGSGVLRSFAAADAATAVQTTGLFQAGSAAFGTRTAPSGAEVWGTVPGGVYPPTAGLSTLELPASNLQGAGEPFLVFWHWFDTEHDGRADPSGSSGDVLWDGGNVKISLDSGASWDLLTPQDGYTGSIIGGPDNPLSGQAAFGGFSHGWRRAVFPLPATSNVRIRFDFGTDATNSEQAEFFAGWLIDDIVISNALPDGSGLPEVVSTPERVTTAPAGLTLPVTTIRVADDVGVSDAWIEYDYTGAAGNVSGTARMVQSMTSLAVYTGMIPAPGETAPGDRVDWRIRLRDVDGNEREYPGDGTTGYRINLRLAQSLPLLATATGGDGWRRGEAGWTGSGMQLGGLVMQPITVAANGANARFTVQHAYRFGVDSAGQFQVSRDGGATWALAEPVGGYGSTFESEGAFRGSASVREDELDLSLMGGEIVQIRLQARGNSDFTEWRVFDAAFTQESDDAAFELPGETVLHANYPDPFSNSTRITYSLPAMSTVELTLYDMLGRRVAVVDSGSRDAGTHAATLQADGLASGVYLLRLDAGGAVQFETVTVAR